MVKLDNSDIKFIKENIDNADNILSLATKDELLTKINEIIITKGFSDDYDLNALGEKAQAVYDNIYRNN